VLRSVPLIREDSRLNSFLGESRLYGGDLTTKPLPAGRRLSPRRLTDVKVFLHDGVQLTKCRLRDISLDGAYVEIQNPALTEDADVELVLKIRRDGKPTHCRLPAKIARADKIGVALMFNELDAQTERVLSDVVTVTQGKQ
jgi:hypothetical protein